MQQVKMDNFRPDPGQAFPPFRALSRAECRVLRDRIASKVGVPATASEAELVRRIDDLAGQQIAPPAVDPEFNLGRALMKAGVTSSETIFLNWYRYDDVDEMRLADVTKFFEDIWYPSSDDLDIFDESLRWILSIRHDGEVKYVNLAR
jgi:hypothetical protein